jgi:flagellar biosynthesis/type III secretory pathway protein FliH
MNEINYPPVKEAMDRIRDLSDDWAAWHEATRRQMAIMDEKQFRKEAIEEGLAEGRAEGRASGLDEGQAKGRIQGQAALLERQLSRRFGPLPEGAHDRLLRATQAQLESWADRVLDARDLTEVFGP